MPLSPRAVRWLKRLRKIPLELAWRVDCRVGADYWLEVSTRWVPAKRWCRSDLSRDPRWVVTPIGPFVLAQKLSAHRI